MKELLVAPSVLAANFAELKTDIDIVNESDADYFHIDIMDGVFVPNISFGFPVTEAIARYAKKPLDFHLMIVNPDNYLESCQKSGASIVTVHYETCKHLHRTVSRIKELGMKAGVAINPHTPVHLVKDLIGEIDLLLVMSVNPGFGGQKFIPHTYHKVSEAKQLAEEFNPDLLIEVDGGVNLETGKELRKSGANMLVAGSFVFKSQDPGDTITSLKNV